jgi:hypothetical protein
MKLPRRNFLHLAAGAAALPVISRFAFAQAYPTRPPTRATFIAELERQVRARATPATRKSDREVAAMPPAILNPRRRRAPARSG